MLKGIDPRVTPDLMDVLVRLGHGDELALVDTNFPAASTARRTASGRLVELPGMDSTAALALILTLLPLDGFTGEAAVIMQKDGAGDTPEPVHRDAIATITPHLPPGGAIVSVPRPAFYARADRAFAVVRCTERRGYGCFILRTGVVF